MKLTILVVLLLSTTLTSFGQAPKCSSLHEGVFRLADGDTTIITRTKKLQVEENAILGVKLIYDITWVDDCTYELRAKTLVKGEPRFAPRKGNVITVRIKEVKANSYVSESRSNYSDLVLKSEIEILK